MKMRPTLCLLAVFLPLAAAAAEPIGEVSASRGNAFLSRQEVNEVAAKGVPVLLDDTALTGDESRLDLRLGQATRLRLGANAKLKIDRFIAGRDAEVTLDKGAAVIERTKGAEPKFEVKTPYALLAARGTEFFAGPSKGVFGVFVKSGIVDVKMGRGTVRLKAGEGTDFAAPGDPPSPVKKWAPARVDAAMWSVR
ncbi:MAG TPA: FecR family protein [Methylocella sp.]|jgi:ferric-dicitrate binding protein FerR (iron transport regulator)